MYQPFTRCGSSLVPSRSPSPLSLPSVLPSLLPISHVSIVLPRIAVKSILNAFGDHDWSYQTLSYMFVLIIGLSSWKPSCTLHITFYNTHHHLSSQTLSYSYFCTTIYYNNNYLLNVFRHFRPQSALLPLHECLGGCDCSWY